jgi:hypothetical protein
VLAKLDRMARGAVAHLDAVSPGGDRSNHPVTTSNAIEFLDVVYLSDTVVFGVAIKPAFVDGMLRAAEMGLADAAVDDLCLSFVPQHAAHLARLALLEPPALAYRGCISFGEFDMRGNFIVGPAVDEAAGAMELAQVAAIWLTPTAAAKLTHGKVLYVPYRVPLKGGDYYETYAVSPFMDLATADECDKFHHAMLATFETAPAALEVQIKRQRTTEFLQRCRSLWRPGLGHGVLPPDEG